MQGRSALGLGVLLVAAATGVSAAPRVTSVLNGSPPHGKQGQRIVFQAEGLVAPVRVFFSDGSNPSVEATGVQFDAARGFLLAQVPAGAQTGNLKVTASGVDSPLYYFRLDAGVFSPGAGTVQGTVSGPGGPLAGAMIALLKPNPCDGEDLVDAAVTGALGDYTLHGPLGDSMLFVFPPTASSLAAGGMPVTVGSSPTTVNVPLSTATIVNGRVVRSAGGSAVASARLEFEGDSGFDTRLTDASGNFSLPLPEGNVKVHVTSSPADALARAKQFFSIGSTGPQTLSDIPLAGGVRIHGTLRRAADGSPLPNVQVSAWPTAGGSDNTDEKVTAGDGSYALVVPAGASYQLGTSLDEDAPFADASVPSVSVGASDVLQDLGLADAGAITGVVLDAGTATPLSDVTVQAMSLPYPGSPVAYTRTCMDGTYRLRVPPSASGYVALAGYGDSYGYVPVAWDGTPEGTFFSCEGTAIPVASAATVVAGITLELPSGAAAVSGTLRSQASGCTTPIPETPWMSVDDGGSHLCSLGWSDWSAPAGTYRMQGLPASDLIAGLRVCYPGTGGESAQCWNVKRPPLYEAVFASPGSEASGVDFCLGSSPVSAVSGLRAGKSGGSITFTWTATTDPYQFQYRLRGATSVKPSTAPGSFPTDPGFDLVWWGPSSAATIPTSTPYRFFLVTNSGLGGAEGPSGSYAP